ncbi:prolyl 4-hydroxylase subunit alpha-1 [Drosophila eugracilis]|uniref:prolyl 4-hydroxylase subunit alpha-1 n=1 Tax=Drosophila eugracilis TaxID=29029 RepID=UPI001BDA9032|nr:prolyl 4-hydroxylase subunit alpha-1 [Drosophila eugracilis]
MLLKRVCTFLLLLFFWKAASSVTFDRHKEFLVAESAKMDLLQLDRELINNLIIYAEKVEEKVAQLQRLVREIRQPLEAAKGVEEEYLGNPLHSFPLIRHMYQDWHYLEEFMKKSVGEEQIDFLKSKLPELPWPADTDEATLAIIRMAEVYGMMPWEMAHGLIDNVRYNSTLSALDCFEIAKAYFKLGQFKEAVQWLTNTRTRMAEPSSGVYEVLGMTSRDVALLEARCLMELGLKEDAEEVLLEQPDLAENSTTLLDQFAANPFKAVDFGHDFTEDYKRLCRSSSPTKSSRLSCRYITTTSPFLILAPLKMEEVSLEPYIMVYHDILPVKDVEELKLLAEHKLKPMEVFGEHGGFEGRSALKTILPYKDMPPSGELLLDRLTKRMRDITGLKICDRHSVNYIQFGFGGHYSSNHHDLFNESNAVPKGCNDRSASFIFYLDDVPHGGATVFPRINVKVSAERGKVLFWRHVNGESHKMDWHASCPVFDGSNSGKKLKFAFNYG